MVIEHNLDVIKTADWMIDLGPEGGAPVAKSLPRAHPRKWRRFAASYTGQALASMHRRMARREPAKKKQATSGFDHTNPAVPPQFAN